MGMNFASTLCKTARRTVTSVLWIRIFMILGLPDPDPSLFCTDPDPVSGPNLNPSINKQKK